MYISIIIMESTNLSTRETATADKVYTYTGREKVPEDVDSVHIHPSITDIPASTFQNCKELKNVICNEGLAKIGCSAFCHCSKLQSINFPSTLIEIGNYAFNCCTNLREVVFNDGLKKIGTQSFSFCESLESITFPSTLLTVGKWALSTYISSLRVVVLNERIQTIEDYAFTCCRNLREVLLLDEGVYHTGNTVFGQCPSLESFKLPSLSIRLKSIIEVSNQREIIESKINSIQGIEKRDSDLLIPARVVGDGINWNVAREIIDQLISVLDYYEVKEATTAIELAFWKAEIQSKAGEIKRNEIDRRGCCIDVPGPVKDTILQYLAYRIYPRGKREKQAFAINS